MFNDIEILVSMVLCYRICSFKEKNGTQVVQKAGVAHKSSHRVNGSLLRIWFWI